MTLITCLIGTINQPVPQGKLEVMYAHWHFYIFLEYVGRSTWKRDTQTAIKIENNVERGGGELVTTYQFKK